MIDHHSPPLLSFLLFPVDYPFSSPFWQRWWQHKGMKNATVTWVSNSLKRFKWTTACSWIKAKTERHGSSYPFSFMEQPKGYWEWGGQERTRILFSTKEEPASPITPRVFVWVLWTLLLDHSYIFTSHLGHVTFLLHNILKGQTF